MRRITIVIQKFFAHPAFLVSGTYVLAYLITVMFLSSAVIGALEAPTASASLVFLPHGIRIIAAWLYGWSAVFYILPGAYITHLARFEEKTALSLSELLGPIFGVLCASFCFSVIARMGHDLRFESGNHINWRDIILVGALASVINSAGTNLVYGNSLHITAGYFVGDILGMITVMFILMLSFRLHRKYS